jgi:hypothetical protein
MQFAFNVLVPARRWWLPVLLLGNLTLLVGPFMLEPLVNEGFEFRGDAALRNNVQGQSVTVTFDDRWYGVERDGTNYWLWASGDGSLLIRNPHPDPLLVRLKFSLSPNGAREVFVRLNGEEIWRTALAKEDNVTANLRDLALRPGDNRVDFHTNLPATTVGEDDRPLAFNLSNLRIELLRRQSAAPEQ